MRVLLAAPEDSTVLGTVGGYCRSALESLGHEVRIFDFRKKPFFRGAFASRIKSAVRAIVPRYISPYQAPVIRAAVDRKVNDEILKIAKEFKPELFLVLLGENISAKTVESIKGLGAVTANWLLDSIILPHRLEFMRASAPAYDHIFLIDSPDVLDKIDFKAAHVDSIPLGCDPEVHNKIELSKSEIAKYGSDIAFVGSVSPERQKVLDELSDFDIKIWGRWQAESDKLKGRYMARDIYGPDTTKIYNASKIVIDIHGRFGSPDGIFNVTPRVFEVPASGTLLMTNDIPQVHSLYKTPDEMVVYSDVAGLRERITYFLAHEPERRSIAERGYKRAHRDHTYARRLTRLIEIVRRK